MEMCQYKHVITTTRASTDNVFSIMLWAKSCPMFKVRVWRNKTRVHTLRGRWQNRKGRRSYWVNVLYIYKCTDRCNVHLRGFSANIQEEVEENRRNGE